MKISKKKIGLVLGPVLFALVMLFFNPENLNPDAKSILSSTIWIAIWWITECVPISVTALLPIVLFPLTGGLDIKSTTASYGHNLVFLFVGGFIIALAIEKWNLHKRVALSIIKFTGTKKSRIILGFMIATAVLSMFISNTATTIMILPVGMAIISKVSESNNSYENINFGKSLMIAIAYSASIGGMATLIGTPPNMIFAGVVKESYGIEIGMLEWSKFGLPVSLFLLMICWIYLTKVAFSFEDKNQASGKQEINNQLKKLGKFSNEELKVSVIFGLTAFGWIFRKQLVKIIPFLDDTIIAISFAIVLFIIPDKKNKPLLNWEDTIKLPWGILLLFGGGMAIASAFGKSGLALWIANLLSTMNGVSLFLLILIIVVSINLLTELTSNMATTAMLLPVLVTMALAINVHPYFLLVSATLAASCAFMLPVATPPNAIVFGSGLLKIEDMFKKGIWMNLFSVIVISLIVYYILPYVFDLSKDLVPLL
ncbi:MAG: anion transporter [Bacteroidetes bacterium MED-G13]|nr:MAG: anion transporter [Bacteroidetes bacterium MED-G13]